MSDILFCVLISIISFLYGIAIGVLVGRYFEIKKEFEK